MADDAVPAPSALELAALRAAAAQAAAEAAQARADAAQAALDAALAAGAAAVPAVDARSAPADRTAGAPPAGPTHAPASGTTAPALSDYAETVRAAYSSPGGVLPLGALLEGPDLASGPAGPGGAGATPVPAAQVGLALSMLNRHGLVAGATGTGKTKTLQGMAEGLSAAGVPVFLADVKGDLSGLIVPGTADEKILERSRTIGQDWQPTAFPVELYSLGGLGTGVPIRTTVTDFGPTLLARVLDLNPTQESSLGLVFHWADTQGLALLDLTDLQAVVAHLLSPEGRAQLSGIGGLAASTAGVILREIVTLQAQGADVFFGEPAFASSDLLRTAADGRGLLSVLELPAVADRPRLFSTFLMWLLADLFQDLPEVGDVDRPRLVFFFDEAHLLFRGASTDFVDQVVQTVRLIRSKGVGIFFITQSPKDVPADVLAQLGNRVQHALRAYTPDDASALRAAVRTFPTSPYDLEQLLQSLSTGEAVVTVLTEKGAPTPVAWTRVRAPQSSMAPAPQATMDAVVAASPSTARYGTAVDNESASELLAARVAASTARAAAEEAAAQQAAADEAAAQEAAKARTAAEKEAAARAQELATMQARLERDAARSSGSSGSGASRSSTARRSGGVQGGLDALLKSAGSALGREITRTLFGTRRR